MSELERASEALRLHFEAMTLPSELRTMGKVGPGPQTQDYPTSVLVLRAGDAPEDLFEEDFDAFDNNEAA